VPPAKVGTHHLNLEIEEPPWVGSRLGVGFSIKGNVSLYSPINTIVGYRKMPRRAASAWAGKGGQPVRAGFLSRVLPNDASFTQPDYLKLLQLQFPDRTEKRTNVGKSPSPSSVPFDKRICSQDQYRQ